MASTPYLSEKDDAKHIEHGMPHGTHHTEGDDAIGVDNEIYDAHGNAKTGGQFKWTVTRVIAVVSLCVAYIGRCIPRDLKDSSVRTFVISLILC